MYQLINENADAVIGEVDMIRDVRRYVELRLRLLSEDAATADPAFQRAFRAYWGMNAARLSTAFFDRYFDTLARCQSVGHTDIPRVVADLARTSPARPSLQFSFVTKLAHMVTPELPVYDSFVAAFYFYVPPESGRGFEERLQELMGFYGFLQREYARIAAKRLLLPAVQAFRARFDLPAAVGDERIIDWLLWGWVSVLRRGALQDGRVRYA